MTYYYQEGQHIQDATTDRVIPDNARAEPPVVLFVSVPVASFRNPYAREYLETYPYPPPSTVYGLLLSCVGEKSRKVHIGVEIAYALLDPKPYVSTVLRTKWRIKDERIPIGTGNNKVPDFQELLTGLKMVIWLRRGKHESASPSLAERVKNLLARPGSASRYGSLCLGESTHMVNDFRAWRDGDGTAGDMLVPADEGGDISLPVWADHVSLSRTRWGRYRVMRVDNLNMMVPDEWMWITVAPDAPGSRV